MSEYPSHRIELLTEQNMAGAIPCLCDSFTREPMLQHVGADYPKVLENFAAVVEKSAFEGLSLVAIDNASDKVIGVMINKDFTAAPVSETHTFCESLMPVFALLETLDQSTDKFDNVKPGEVFHPFMVGVDPNSNIKGLAVLMSEKSLALAKAKGYREAVLEATGRASQHIYKNRLGYSTIGSIIYREFEFEGQRPFADMQAADCCELAWKCLD